MAQAFRCIFPVMPAWAGVGVDGGAIAGNSKVFRRDKSAIDGGEDSGMVKEKRVRSVKQEKN